MSDIQPKGYKVVLLDGVEREILFTLSAVDEIQSFYDMPVSEVFTIMATDSRQQYSIFAEVLTRLLNDQARRDGRKKDEYLTKQAVMDLVDVPAMYRIEKTLVAAFKGSFPDDGDEDPNAAGSRSS